MRPQFYDDAYIKLVESASLAADYTSAAIDMRFYNTALIQVRIDSTSTPLGNLYIHGSIDGTNYHPIYLDDNSVHGLLDTTDLTSPYSHTGAYLVAVTGTADSDLTFALTDGMRYYKVHWDRTSGGSTTGLDIYATRR